MHPLRNTTIAAPVSWRSIVKSAWNMITLMILLDVGNALAADAPGEKRAKDNQATSGEMRPEKMFQRFDSNKDGHLSETEFLSAPTDPWSSKRDFRLFDLDEDGQLSYEEF